GAAVIEEVYDDAEQAAALRAQAERLRDQLEERFWWEAEDTYYLGLNGEKRPIESVTSNPGHLLWAGVVDPDRARRVAGRLLAEDMWSGWGVRTLSARHPAYNPFSYQLGSVWPHDNAICAAGFRNYWLDEVTLENLRLGDAAVDISVCRAPAGGHELDVKHRRGHIEVRLLD